MSGPKERCGLARPLWGRSGEGPPQNRFAENRPSRPDTNKPMSVRMTLLMALLLTVGCGSDSAGIGLVIAGSYELVFHGVQVGGIDGISPAPSEGQAVRVDVRVADDGFDVVSSPAWLASPKLGSGNFEDGVLVLRNVAGVASEKNVHHYQDVHGPIADHFDEVRLDIDDDQRLVGSGVATGRQGPYRDYESSWDKPLSASVSVRRDATSPQMAATELQQGLLLLPWVRTRVTSSEPLVQAAFSESIVVQDSASITLVVPWQPLPMVDDTVWAGITGLEARLPWSALSAGGSVTLRVGGATDPSGLAAAEIEHSFVVEAIGAAKNKIDAATPAPTSWGAAAVAPCDAEQCLNLGPFSVSKFNTNGPAGFAGQLAAAGGSTLLIRYRVLSDQPIFDAQPWHLELFTESGEPQNVTSGLASEDYAKEPSGTYRTGFVELAVPIDGKGNLGFALHAGCGHICKSPITPEERYYSAYYTVTIQVSSIEVK